MSECYGEISFPLMGEFLGGLSCFQSHTGARVHFKTIRVGGNFG